MAAKGTYEGNKLLITYWDQTVQLTSGISGLNHLWLKTTITPEILEALNKAYDMGRADGEFATKQRLKDFFL